MNKSEFSNHKTYLRILGYVLGVLFSVFALNYLLFALCNWLTSIEGPMPVVKFTFGEGLQVTGSVVSTVVIAYLLYILQKEAEKKRADDLVDYEYVSYALDKLSSRFELLSDELRRLEIEGQSPNFDSQDVASLLVPFSLRRQECRLWINKIESSIKNLGDGGKEFLVGLEIVKQGFEAIEAAFDAEVNVDGTPVMFLSFNNPSEGGRALRGAIYQALVEGLICVHSLRCMVKKS